MCKRHLNIKTQNYSDDDYDDEYNNSYNENYDKQYNEKSKKDYKNIYKMKNCKGIQKEVINSIKYSTNHVSLNSINFEIKNELDYTKKNTEIIENKKVIEKINNTIQNNVNQKKEKVKSLKVQVSKKPDNYKYESYYSYKPSIKHFEFVQYID